MKYNKIDVLISVSRLRFRQSIKISAKKYPEFLGLSVHKTRKPAQSYFSILPLKEDCGQAKNR
jgi:hypothetical protein